MKKSILETIKDSACGHLNPHLNEPVAKPATKVPATKRRHKIKAWIALNLHYWAQAKGYELLTEHKFDIVRKWRFDWVLLKGRTEEEKTAETILPHHRICALEYNGIMADKSRHTTVEGYTGDMEKINAAQALGWLVYQYTPLNYKNILRDLEKL